MNEIRNSAEAATRLRCGEIEKKNKEVVIVHEGVAQLHLRSIELVKVSKTEG